MAVAGWLFTTTREVQKPSGQSKHVRELEEVEADLENAKQELAQAKLDLEFTEYQIAQSSIRAPFTALVVERLQSPGEYTGVGQTLLRVVNLIALKFKVRARQRITYIANGMTLAFQ